MQDYFKLSNWFSLWCLVSWMNHLPYACWSTARFTNLNDSQCVHVIQWRGIFNDCICLNLCLFMHMITNFSHYFPIIWPFFSKCFVLQSRFFSLNRVLTCQGVRNNAFRWHARYMRIAIYTFWTTPYQLWTHMLENIYITKWLGLQGCCETRFVQHIP